MKLKGKPMRNMPISEMAEPKGYNISLCFEWMNWDSCLTFEIVTDGVIANKVDMVRDLIDAWGGIVEMEDDGTVVNLSQFKTAYVVESKKGWGDIDPSKKPTNLRVVH